MSLTFTAATLPSALKVAPGTSAATNPTNSRRGFKKGQCPIQFEGKIKSAGFVRKSTEKTSWEEAKVVADSFEAAVGTAPTRIIPEPQAVTESASVAKRDEPVTIERVASEFMADIEARQMDESKRRKYRTMLKQLQAYADEFGFRYLSHFTVEELTKFRATWKDGLRSGANKLERVRAVFRFAQKPEWIPQIPASKLKPPMR